MGRWAGELRLADASVFAGSFAPAAPAERHLKGHGDGGIQLGAETEPGDQGAFLQEPSSSAEEPGRADDSGSRSSASDTVPSPEPGVVGRRSVHPCKASDACRAIFCVFVLLLQLSSIGNGDIKGLHAHTRVLWCSRRGQTDPHVLERLVWLWSSLQHCDTSNLAQSAGPC